jgi:hypothetical protein
MEIALRFLLLEEVSLFPREVYFSVGKLHVGIMADLQRDENKEQNLV